LHILYLYLKLIKRSNPLFPSLLPRHPLPSRVLAALLLAAAGTSCKKKPAPAPVEVKLPPAPEWPFGEQGIRLRYSADPGLNQVDGAPHSAVLAVYQLADANPFLDKAKTPEGLRVLLDGKTFDPSVVSVDRLFVQPGAQDLLLLDRTQGARWLALAVGYYDLRGTLATRCLAIPKPRPELPTELCVELALGPTEIRGLTTQEQQK
jgi:hypothetical protein